MRARLTRLKESLRASLWTMPSAAVVAAVSAGLMVSGVQAGPEHPLAWFAYPGGVEGARGLLQVIAGSMITVTSLTFTLTVVVLQMAASQYSPRLLRTFVGDLGNQAVLAIFLSTFAFSLTVLPSVRSPTEDKVRFVPNVGVTLALLLALASLGGLVYFIHHVTRSIRVEAIMLGVRSDTLDSIKRNLGEMMPLRGGMDQRLGDPGEQSVRLRATRSGYLQALDAGPLVAVVAEHNARLTYRSRVGEYVTEDSVLAWAWSTESTELSEGQVEELSRAANSAVTVGFERNLVRDIGFGVRQLVDIAVKALSTGMNDPTTAVDTLGHLSVLLHELALRPLGSEVLEDPESTPRVGVPRPAFEDYLAMVCAGIIHYGAQDLAVVRRLLRLLEDLGTIVTDDGRKDAIGRWIDLLAEEADAQLQLESKRESVRRGADQAHRSLSGEVVKSDFMLM